METLVVRLLPLRKQLLWFRYSGSTLLVGLGEPALLPRVTFGQSDGRWRVWRPGKGREKRKRPPRAPERRGRASGGGEGRS